MSRTALSEVLQTVMRRAGIGAQTLSKLTGIPRTAIDNWRDGNVRRPRHWQPLLRIATALSLPRQETDDLLAAAGHPCVSALDASVPAGHPDRDLLSPWATHPPARSPARHQLRAPAADFVGRVDALKRVASLLTDLNGRAAVVGIRGMGGIGKTELALAAANELGESFPAGQLVVNLRGVGGSPLSPADAMRGVVHAFEPDDKLGDDPETVQHRYRTVLAGRRVLILADDAADAAQVHPLLTPAGSALLVTSRQLFTVPGMVTVDLDELSEDEAARLLGMACDRLTVDDARRIAAACGHLPLALRISAGLLHNDPALDVADHLAALTDRRRRLAHLRDPDDERLDVTASLALSLARLDDSAQAVFRQLGVLSGDFDTALAEAVVRVSGADTGSTLRLLLRRSLIGFGPTGRRWRLHDLVRDLARRSAEEEGDWEPAMWRYVDAGIRIGTEIGQQYEAGGDAMSAALSRFDAERAHLDAGRRWLDERAGEERADRMFVASALAIERYAYMRYNLSHELMPIAERAIAAATRTGNRAAEVRVLNQIGYLDLETGRLREAAEHFERLVTLARQIGDQIAELRALNNLSVAYSQIGRPRDAIALSLRQLDLSRTMGHPLGEAIALTNLARTRLYVGEPLLAREHLECGLVIIRELGDRVGECIALDNMSTIHHVLGDRVRAIASAEEAHRIATSLGDRQRTAEALATLAEALVPVTPPSATAAGPPDPDRGAGNGPMAEAPAAAKRAVALARELGARRTEAKALRALGRAYSATGEPDSAGQAFEQALAVAALTDDKSAAAECSWLLGLHLLPSDRERAFELARRAVEYWTAVGHARATEFHGLLAELCRDQS